MNYKITKNLPVAKFWYKGHHSHPVKRTILIIEANREFLLGYEVREGNKVRTLNDAPIKKFLRKKIAKGQNLRLDNKLRKEMPKKSTLIRKNIFEIIQNGF